MGEITSFGDWVRRRRKALDLTQAVLAQRVGYALVTIKKIEQETRLPSRQLAELLADQLAIPKASRAAFIHMARGEYVATLPSVPSTTYPSAFLTAIDPPAKQASTYFVGREHALAQLELHLDATLASQGRVVFIVGGAGRGKTTLMTEFARRAQAMHPEVIVAVGNCNAYAGVGDPYLPFRDVLALLTGDLKTQWAAGALSSIEARRLWALFPRSVEALINYGPNLLDVLVPGEQLLQRLVTYMPDRTEWQTALQLLLEQQQTRTGMIEPRQIFEQYMQVLRALVTYERPRGALLILLDDLQWIDQASLSLLFHLGQRLTGSPILIVGAYRPSEVVLARFTGAEAPAQHPLAPVIQEFTRQSGDIQIDLGRLAPEEERAFIDALLDQGPNRLGEAFRTALFWHTKGHPLFTVELLRNMRERGDLVQDQAGRWIEGAAVDWGKLPARVEAVIAQRLAHLPARLQAALKIASVEGEVFTAEIMAQVQGVDERQMVQALSEVVDRQHRLITGLGIQRLGDQQLSHYRFQHILVQKYLYDGLDEAERVYLHEAVGKALEALYQGQTAEVALALARHFQAAGLVWRAVEYLQQAGEQALRRYANQEAVMLFQRALALLVTLPDTQERAEHELALQTNIGVPLVALSGYGAAAVHEVYTRAWTLCQQLDTPPSPTILRVLAIAHLVRSNLPQACKLGEQLLRVAQQVQTPILDVEAHYVLGVTTFWCGEFVRSRDHLAQALTKYNAQYAQAHITSYSQDPGVICPIRLALTLWCLGYPDQAFACSQDSLARAYALQHPLSLAYALNYAAWLTNELGEWQTMQTHVEEMMALAQEKELNFWPSTGVLLQGWLLCTQGAVAEGLVQTRQGLAAFQEVEQNLHRPYLFALAARTFAKAGEFTEGLTTLTAALAMTERNSKQFWDAELYRLRGELLLQQTEATDKVESCFRKALTVAHQQNARSLELRAALSLSKLWEGQGKRKAARQMVSALVDWFTEGFATPDLQAAKRFLAEQ